MDVPVLYREMVCTCEAQGHEVRAEDGDDRR